MVVARAVAVGHAEAAVVPERVHVRVAVVDPAVRGHAVVAQTVAAVHVLVVVPGQLRAVGGVGAGGLAVGGRAVAPRVVRPGEQGSGAGAAPVQVVRLVVAAAGVGQRVVAARLRAAEGDLAAVLGVADALLDRLPLGDLRAGPGVGDHVQLARGDAVALDTADDGLVGEDGGAFGGPDHLAGALLGLGVLAAARRQRGEGGAFGGRGGHGGGGVRDLDLVVGGLGHALGHAALGVDREVTAEHGQTVVGALVRGVRGAVRILDDIADDELLLATETEGLRGLRGGGVGARQERRTLRGAEGLGSRARVGLDGLGRRGRGGVCGGGTCLNAYGEHRGGGYEGADGGGTPVGGRTQRRLLLQGGSGRLGGPPGRAGWCDERIEE
ncbi:hypothetical protein EES37_14505 [Streptomyces sp. ADI91-18]|nr:hypothetical protein EES37_14505 [Streptomyces sp. ADI91-18]